MEWTDREIEKYIGKEIDASERFSLFSNVKRERQMTLVTKRKRKKRNCEC